MSDFNEKYVNTKLMNKSINAVLQEELRSAPNSINLNHTIYLRLN